MTETAHNFADAFNSNMNGLDKELGVRMLVVTRDQVVMEYEVTERHLQPYGIVHGGVHCAMVESACSTGAGVDAMSRGLSVVGLENHTSFIRAVRSGTIRVTALPVTRGRRSQVWEATARDSQNRIVASGRVRLLCLDTGSDLAGAPVGTDIV